MKFLFLCSCKPYGDGTARRSSVWIYLEGSLLGEVEKDIGETKIGNLGEDALSFESRQTRRSSPVLTVEQLIEFSNPIQSAGRNNY